MTFAIPGTVVGPSLAGRPVDLAASGESVLGSQPTDVDDAFHIGSMTKLFTAELIMQLDQEGLLSLVGRRNGQHGKGSGELAPCPSGRRLTARPGARAVPFQDQRAVTGRPALV